MTNFPTKIIFLADQNEAELRGLIAKTDQATYEYTKSKTKKGISFYCSLEYLRRLEGAKLLMVKK